LPFINPIGQHGAFLPKYIHRQRKHAKESIMTTCNAASKHYAARNDQQLRELLRRDFGTRKYKITADGDVHVHGKMPNSILTGWYLKGSKCELMRDYQII
jgi:hypothetical protein